MPKQRSIEEQLADAQAKKARAQARLQQLEMRRKQRDSRLRLKGEKVLARLVLDRLTIDPALKGILLHAAEKDSCKPEEREALRWLLDQLDGKMPEEASPAPPSALREFAAEARRAGSTPQAEVA